MLLHYFFLSAFAWMLVEGLHLSKLEIKVFRSKDSKHRHNDTTALLFLQNFLFVHLSSSDTKV